MITSVQKWGNSQGIRIPISVMKELNLSNGQAVELYIENDSIVIKKAENKRKTIRELFEDYSGEYECSEIDWGEREGNEEW